MGIFSNVTYDMFKIQHKTRISDNITNSMCYTSVLGKNNQFEFKSLNFNKVTKFQVLN